MRGRKAVRLQAGVGDERRLSRWIEPLESPEEPACHILGTGPTRLADPVELHQIHPSFSQLNAANKGVFAPELSRKLALAHLGIVAHGDERLAKKVVVGRECRFFHARILRSIVPCPQNAGNL